jgi:hypothetical protein
VSRALFSAAKPLGVFHSRAHAPGPFVAVNACPRRPSLGLYTANAGIVVWPGNVSASAWQSGSLWGGGEVVQDGSTSFIQPWASVPGLANGTGFLYYEVLTSGFFGQWVCLVCSATQHRSRLRVDAPAPVRPGPLMAVVLDCSVCVCILSLLRPGRHLGFGLLHVNASWGGDGAPGLAPFNVSTSVLYEVLGSMLVWLADALPPPFVCARCTHSPIQTTTTAITHAHTRTHTAAQLFPVFVAVHG